MITNLLTKINKELEELNYQLRDNDYLNDLEKRINIINERINTEHQQNIKLKSIIEEVREYIEEHKQKGYRTPMSDDYEFWNELDENEIKELLQILDKENI